MNMRERCALSVLTILYPNGVRESLSVNRRVIVSPEIYQQARNVVDVVLDALTANPGEAVLDAALGAPTQDENGINCFEIMTTGEAFCAMIKAIKAGK